MGDDGKNLLEKVVSEHSEYWPPVYSIFQPTSGKLETADRISHAQIEYSRELRQRFVQDTKCPKCIKPHTIQWHYEQVIVALCLEKKVCVESGDIEYSISKNIHPERRSGYVFCPQNFPPFHVVAG